MILYKMGYPSYNKLDPAKLRELLLRRYHNTYRNDKS